MNNTITVYHISRLQRRESILKNGLTPQAKTSGRIRYAPSIFVSTKKCDVTCLWLVNADVMDCWAFEVSKDELTPDPFSLQKEHFFLSKPIPANKIKFVEEIQM